MNLLNRVMSYDKTKVNQESCNCEECVGITDVSEKKEIIGNFRYADDFLRKIENYQMICKEKEFLTILNLKYWYKDKKTKTFIWKALFIHGDKYDYYETLYINNKTKVKIGCRVKGHDVFTQRTNDHIYGHGCSKCKGCGKLTLEEFIKEANKVHGEGRYDYSEVVYKNNKTKVCIICHNHEEPFRFMQKPNDHIQGHGCPKCARKLRSETQRMSLEEFIERARKIHGDKYDYSKVIYINKNTKVIIICPIHGKFKQSPDKHLNGCGCQKCNKNKGEEAIRKFLNEKEIEFEEQKKFKGCKYKQLLKFDFYIPKYNLCIESDGNIHFEKINWTGKMTDEEMEENLKSNQLRDQIKNDYCKNNKINLLRIRYDENIEEKLTEYFKENYIKI